MGVHFKFEDEIACTFLRGETIFLFSNGEFGLAYETMGEYGNIWRGRFDSFGAVISEIERIKNVTFSERELKTLRRHLKIK